MAGYFQTASDLSTAVTTIRASVVFQSASGLLVVTVIVLVTSKGLQARDVVFVQHIFATGSPPNEFLIFNKAAYFQMASDLWIAIMVVYLQSFNQLQIC